MGAPLDVLLVRESNPNGGVRSHIETLERALASEVRFRDLYPAPTAIAWRGAIWLRSGFSIPRARARHLDYRLRSIESLLRTAAASSPPDLVHAHDALTGAVAIAMHRDGSGPPVVLTVHAPLSREIRMDLHDDPFAERVRSLEARCYAGADRLLAVDTGQAHIVHEDFGIPLERLRVIPNAVDAPAVRALAKATLAGPAGRELRAARASDPHVMVLPRRLVEKNGPAVALEALARLPGDWQLWIVGDGPLRPALVARAAAAGVAARVRFMGERSRAECIAAMSLADVVIVPSVPSHGVVEATSLAALEAMALGLPVVASRIGGLAELIRDGENGCLVPAGDADAMALAIRGLTRERAAQLGAGGMAFVDREWSVSRWGAAILEAYRETVV